jgi:hypothetical protein
MVDLADPDSLKLFLESLVQSYFDQRLIIMSKFLELHLCHQYPADALPGERGAVFAELEQVLVESNPDARRLLGERLTEARDRYRTYVVQPAVLPRGKPHGGGGKRDRDRGKGPDKRDRGGSSSHSAPAGQSGQAGGNQ